RVALHLGEGSIGRLPDSIVERGASQPLLRQPNPSVGLDQPRGLAQRLAGKRTFSTSREDAGAPVKALRRRRRDGEQAVEGGARLGQLAVLEQGEPVLVEGRHVGGLQT